jgi:hypothetical protein
MDKDLTLKALQLGFVTEAEFDRVVDPAKMVHPCIAQANGRDFLWSCRWSVPFPTSRSHL